MKKELTSQNVTRQLTVKGSPPARALRRYLEVPGERRFDELTKITLASMGYGRGPEGSPFKSIPAADYEAAVPIVERVAAKLKKRTILPGPAEPLTREAGP